MNDDGGQQEVPKPKSPKKPRTIQVKDGSSYPDVGRYSRSTYSHWVGPSSDMLINSCFPVISKGPRTHLHSYGICSFAVVMVLWMLEQNLLGIRHVLSQRRFGDHRNTVASSLHQHYPSLTIKLHVLKLTNTTKIIKRQEVYQAPR